MRSVLCLEVGEAGQEESIQPQATVAAGLGLFPECSVADGVEVRLTLRRMLRVSIKFKIWKNNPGSVCSLKYELCMSNSRKTILPYVIVSKGKRVA